MIAYDNAAEAGVKKMSENCVFISQMHYFDAFIQSRQCALVFPVAAAVKVWANRQWLAFAEHCGYCHLALVTFVYQSQGARQYCVI